MTTTAPKWRVERSGSPSNYGPGWLAMDALEETGAWFRTHAEAFTFALNRARAEFERDSKRALIKLAPRGVTAAGLAPSVRPVPTPKRSYHRITDAELRAARRMRSEDRSWADIGHTLGVKPQSIMKAVARAEQEA